VATVGSQDASQHFSAWLTRVEQGEELVITKDGSPVARLVPAIAARPPIDRQAAIVEMREIAQRNHLNGLRVKDLAAEGRR
jgi:prevent-host-death family protein